MLSFGETDRRFKMALNSTILCLLPGLAMLFAMLAIFKNDHQTGLYFHQVSLEFPELSRAFEIYSDWGNGLLYAFYGFILLVGRHKNRPELFFFAAACLIAQILIVLIVNPFIKEAIGRPRPFQPGPRNPFAFDGVHVSFPSGHTTAMTGLMLPLLGRFGRGPLIGLAFGLPIALMGLARIYLNMHYPSDVLGGMLMGVLLSYLAQRIYAFFLDLDKCPQPPAGW